ncbi:MAG: glycosyltransferase family 39 protein [Sedimentisphaerales bacterium]|nr:glycosyltransferase family 39 protein [Sedimentisphaerales bacterium]
MVMRNGLKAVAILVGIMALYGLLASSSTLWDRDEPRFARATMEMVESGNYLYPTFNGQLRPDKPILIYWAMSVFVRILGSRELAFRLPSIVGTAISCYITYLMARRLSCAETGLWAMAILATSLMAIVEGTAATADGLLLACMMGAMWQFMKVFPGRMGIGHAVALGLALGLAMLAKGPVGLLPVLIILSVVYLVEKGQLRLTNRLWPVVFATAIAICIFIAWALPANVATGGLFAKAGLGHHVMGRSLRPLEGHGGRWLVYLPYYIPVALVFLFPWTIHLPGAISAFIGRRIADRRICMILLAWIGVVFVIMTIVATKLPHYVLFAWPALAMVLARVITLAKAGRLTQQDLRWLRVGVLLYAPLATGAALGLGSLGWVLGIPKWPGVVAAAILALTAIAAISFQFKGRICHGSYVLLGGSVLLLLAISVLVMPAIEKVKISLPLAKAILGHVGADTPIATFGYAEPSLNFYLGKRMEHLVSAEQVLEWVHRPGRGILVVSDPQQKVLQDQDGLAGMKVIAQVNGYNFSKGKRVTVWALAKDSIDG